MNTRISLSILLALAPPTAADTPPAGPPIVVDNPRVEGPPAPRIVAPEPSAVSPIDEPAPELDPELDYDPVRLQQALDRLPAHPTLEEAQRGALNRAGVDAKAAGRWLRRARTAAALPTVTVQYDRRFDRSWTLNQEAGEADALRNNSGNQDTLRTKATWNLDRLIFSPDELRAARAVLDVADSRERLLVQITRLYFERQRILLERELEPPTTLDEAIDINLRLRELEGLLSGLTGLDFASTPGDAPPTPRRSRGR
jgi:hypothetical protein